MYADAFIDGKIVTTLEQDGTGWLIVGPLDPRLEVALWRGPAEVTLRTEGKRPRVVRLASRCAEHITDDLMDRGLIEV